MTLTKSIFAVAALLAVSGAATVAQASVEVFTNEAAFDAAISNAATFGFTGVAEDQWFSTFPGGLQVGPVRFSTPGTLFVFSDDYRGNPYGTTAAASAQGIGGAKASLDMSISSSSISAIGFDYGSYTTLGALSDIVINGVDVGRVTTPIVQGASNFIGFLSSAPITSVAFNNTSAPAIDILDFTTGSALAAGVPEPSEWALMIVGVAMIGGVLRLARKRAGHAVA
jgi:hypothetical protein